MAEIEGNSAELNVASERAGQPGRFASC